MAKVITCSISDLITSLQLENCQRDNFIYMQIDWQAGAISYHLICPCRCINFPNAGLTDRPYVQPISGDVLIEHNDRFHLAYVSTYVPPDATQKTELILSDQISLFKLKHYSNYRRGFIPAIAY